MTKRIGPAFADELSAAGLTGLELSWTPDGNLTFGSVTELQRTAVLAVYEAHDAATLSLAAAARAEIAATAPITLDQLAAALLRKGVISAEDFDETAQARAAVLARA